MTTPTLVTVAATRQDLARGLAGQSGRRAVVMTMGALHDGHLALVRRAREVADHVVVTVFVNPLQFGPGEDFAAYPRDLAADVDLLAAEGVDVIFAPSAEQMYPDGPPAVRIDAGPTGERFEGAVRPGHFSGMLTVVHKLLSLTAPQVALFGQKDAQQLALVRQMVRDLDLGVEVLAVPTVRDADGLALSSRNAFLSTAHRTRALALSGALRAGQAAARDGATAVLRAATAVLEAADGLAVDYVALVDADDFTEVPADHDGPAVLAVAARVGGTRLIDNLPVRVGNGSR